MRVPREEFDAAALTAERVFEAIVQGDSRICAESFHPSAMIFGQTNGSQNIGPYTNLLRQIDHSKVGAEFNYRVDVVSLEDTIALVQVLENNYNGNFYTVYCTEIKLEGKWKIVSFVYNQNKEPYQ